MMRRVERVNSFDGRAARFQAGISGLDGINVVFGHLKFWYATCPVCRLSVHWRALFLLTFYT